MHALAAIAGVLIVGIVSRDIFHTIFNPRGTGSIGDFLASLLWKLFRLVSRRSPALFPYAGPISMILIMFTWAAALVLGWGLIYFSFMPGDFVYPGEMLGGRTPGVIDALYCSSLTFINLGGNMAPSSLWARFLVPLESLQGFGVFSAGISWILSMYPILNRRRSFAKEVFDLRQMDEEEGRDVLASEATFCATVLYDLAQELVVIRGDIVQFPISYYFRAFNPRMDMPAILPYALELARRGEGASSGSVVIAARFLEMAIREYLATLAPMLGQSEDQRSIDLLETFRNEHLRTK